MTRRNPSLAAQLAASMTSGDPVAPTDSMGIALMEPDGWPHYFIEQATGGLQHLHVVAGEMVGVDIIHDGLIGAGMSAVRDTRVPPEPSYDGPLRFFVQRHDNARRPSGIYGPGADGRPGGLTLISPLPPWPAEFNHIVPTFDWQMGIYLTTHTENMWKLHGQELRAAILAEGDAGRLLGARAAVL